MHSNAVLLVVSLAVLLVDPLAMDGSAVFAQSSPFTTFEPPRPGQTRPPLPELEEEAPEPEIILPPVPPPVERAPLSRGPRFELRRVAFEGNKVFSDEELQEVAKPFLDQLVSAEDLESLRRNLSLHYIDAGYVNSGAVLPDQAVEEGVVAYRIIEGVLSKITVVGDLRLRPGYIEDRIWLDAGPPLNVNRLQRRLRLLLEDPLIDRIDAELGPGLRPGESELTVRVAEASPAEVTLFTDNYRAPSVGGKEVGGLVTLRDLTGFGEIAALEASAAQGLVELKGQFAVPLGVSGTQFIGLAEYTETEVVEKPFSELDVEGETIELEATLRQPIYREPGQEFAASLTFNWRRSTTFLLGERFSFVEGADNGRTTVSAIRGIIDWIDRSQDHVIALRSTVSAGIDAFGATTNSGSTPDGEFVSWLGQAQWVQRLGPSDIRLVLRGEAQLTNDRLLPLEKFALGGFDTVRGYRENLFIRDNAWQASVEFRIPVLDLDIPDVPSDLNDGRVELAPFFDIGQAWDSGSPESSTSTIASIGIGLRWSPIKDVLATLYYGYALNEIDTPDSHDIQDDGINFSIRATVYRH